MSNFIEIQDVLFNKIDIQIVKKTWGSCSEPSIAVVMKIQECYVLPFRDEDLRNKKFSLIKDELLGVQENHPLDKMLMEMFKNGLHADGPTKLEIIKGKKYEKDNVQ